LIAALAALPAAAADPLTEEGLTLRLGGFYSTSDTTLRLDASNGALGTSISLEDDLGYEKNKALPMFDAVWRINPRHRLELGFVKLGRDAQKTLSGEVRFGDKVFPFATTVNSEFDSDVWRLTYGWSFYRQGGNELSLLLGVHTTSFKAKMESASGLISEAADRTIPLPTIGLSGAWEMGKDWRLTGWAQLFSLKYGDYDGSLVNGAVNAEYRFNRNYSVGAGYTLFDYNLDVTKGKGRGSFDYRFAGPVLYLNASFF
jgi:hypothetical protein